MLALRQKFCHFQKSVDNDVTYEEIFPTSKILVSFLFFNMANLLQIKRISAESSSGKCDKNPREHPQMIKHL